MGRILAIDYGKIRTGIAVTDELQIIASGLTTVLTKELIPFLKSYTETEKVELFIVGLPKQMNNEASESEVLIGPFLEKLEKKFSNFSHIYCSGLFFDEMFFVYASVISL